MTIEERLAMVERKLEAFEAAVRAQPDAIREEIREAFHRHDVKLTVHENGAMANEHIRQIAAAGFGAAQRDYHSRRG
ncbi:MAG: hypothetical protein E5X53_26350 [Mesorhizobium sp.]|uniref:hypothetical protein n=1 Tax=Mesorhizobium sp. TaxID=1871066 RepID=UPI001229512C|nr:hypothetical protein [Mesorhizobium sp.]TIP70587.1 MAG: hypothetical protein E5X55_26600 [Mesorhizobium sp.]TIQ06777.1 MAG: hypothetical protein E5X57_24310 [Mesorhizobium sp.]TIR49021.1 MAG: hypothetical protein E5X53_26350 [Mesorhizobium sp.]TJV94856.1 MAG: hypothetical protein E5X52_26875 [Mesorhizobium sp.]